MRTHAHTHTHTHTQAHTLFALLLRFCRCKCRMGRVGITRSPELEEHLHNSLASLLGGGLCFTFLCALLDGCCAVPCFAGRLCCAVPSWVACTWRSCICGSAAYVGLASTVYIYTVYDRIFGDLPAKNALYTPYLYGFGQPYAYAIILRGARYRCIKCVCVCVCMCVCVR
jgi:hypothetical protein